VIDGEAGLTIFKVKAEASASASPRPSLLPEAAMSLSFANCSLVQAGNRLVRGLLPALLAVAVHVHAQQSAGQAPLSNDTAAGVKLYREGRTQEAITALRAALVQNQKDADAWHYLGLAFSRERYHDMAIEALRKAVKLRPRFSAARAALAYLMLLSGKVKDAEKEAARAISHDASNAEAHYVIASLKLRKGDYKGALQAADRSLRLKPDLAAALEIKAQALFGVFGNEYGSKPAPQVDRLKEAVQALEDLIKSNPGAPVAAVLRPDVEALHVYLGYLDKPGGERSIYRLDEVTTRPVITYRQKAIYTEDARQNKVSGAVQLLAVFTSDGKIEGVIPVKWLPGGLTETAIRAARRIRFQPATKDGKPVSVIMKLEFQFSIF
jgi:tetratricopeptide (TPR) repeat protein